MKVNNLKKLDKYFPYMPYPTRLAPSAILRGVKGTEQQRTELAQELNNKLFKLIDDVFEQKIKMGKKPKLDIKELLSCIKQVVPNIKIKISEKLNRDEAGTVENIFDKTKKTIVGFRLSLGGNLEQGVNENNLRHEMRHDFDSITQPKINARFNTANLIGRLPNYTDYIDDKHYNFFDRVLYQEKNYEDSQRELEYLTKKIKKHFKKLETPPEEKIEMLQTWRHSLKSEMNAYKDESEFACNGGNVEEYMEVEIGDYFFEPKIKLIEKMLKDEIASVRKISAEKYGKKSKV